MKHFLHKFISRQGASTPSVILGLDLGKLRKSCAEQLSAKLVTSARGAIQSFNSVSSVPQCEASVMPDPENTSSRYLIAGSSGKVSRDQSRGKRGGFNISFSSFMVRNFCAYQRHLRILFSSSRYLIVGSSGKVSREQSREKRGGFNISFSSFMVRNFCAYQRHLRILFSSSRYLIAGSSGKVSREQSRGKRGGFNISFSSFMVNPICAYQRHLRILFSSSRYLIAGSRYVLSLAILCACSWMLTSCSSNNEVANKKESSPSPKPAKVTIKTADKPAHRVLSSRDTQGQIMVPQSLPELSKALDLGNERTFRKRQQILEASYMKMSPSSLPSARELQQMEDFILSTRKLEGMSSSRSHAFKNDLLNLLLKYKEVKPEYESQLQAMLQKVYENTDQDRAMRDYALQFMEEDTTVLSSHWQSLSPENIKKSPQLAATSMELLRSRDLTQAEQKKLLHLAYQCIKDSKATTSLRSTALEICSQYHHPQTEQHARELADSHRADFFLRITAIQVLGSVGSSEETKELLKRLSSGMEKRLRHPAQQALKKLDNKKVSRHTATPQSENTSVNSVSHCEPLVMPDPDPASSGQKGGFTCFFISFNPFMVKNINVPSRSLADKNLPLFRGDRGVCDFNPSLNNLRKSASSADQQLSTI